MKFVIMTSSLLLQSITLFAGFLCCFLLLGCVSTPAQLKPVSYVDLLVKDSYSLKPPQAISQHKYTLLSSDLYPEKLVFPEDK